MSCDEFKKYSEKHGKRNLIMFVLIDSKREIKEDTLFVKKAKNVFRMYSGIEGFLINLNVAFN